jgi:hypothetical protein
MLAPWLNIANAPAQPARTLSIARGPSGELADGARTRSNATAISTKALANSFGQT